MRCYKGFLVRVSHVRAKVSFCKGFFVRVSYVRCYKGFLVRVSHVRACYFCKGLLVRVLHAARRSRDKSSVYLSLCT